MLFRIAGITFPQTTAQLTATSGEVLFEAIRAGRAETADTAAASWFEDAGVEGHYVDPEA